MRYTANNFSVALWTFTANLGQIQSRPIVANRLHSGTIRAESGPNQGRTQNHLVGTYKSTTGLTSKHEFASQSVRLRNV